jgi:hypothetical protein
MYRISIANLARLICLLALASQSSNAQTFSLIHSFAGNEGNSPYGGITLDAQGNLYGTNAFGGRYGGGTVYELMRRGTEWNIAVLHNFGSGDGEVPLSRVVFGPDSNLYGTTSLGSVGENANGTAFMLSQPPAPCVSGECPWKETILHNFNGLQGGDGAEPYYGDLIFDARGNIFGTTTLGGLTSCLCGTVFQIYHSPAGWQENIVYSFGVFGSYPLGGPTLDRLGNLYGTTTSSSDAGQVYELSNTSATWSGKSIHGFYDQGAPSPNGAVTFDNAGNIYGTTASGGPGGAGFVFELSPSDTGWIYQDLYDFVDESNSQAGTLTIGPDGSLYGALGDSGPGGAGQVFKLTPSQNGWVYTDLHDFDYYDGAVPVGQVAVDSQGNVFGTAYYAGPTGNGVVFQILAR